MLLGRKKRKRTQVTEAKHLRRLSILARERRTSHLHRSLKILDAQFREVFDGFANI